MTEEEWIRAIKCNKEELIQWLNDMYKDNEFWQNKYYKLGDKLSYKIKDLEEEGTKQYWTEEIIDFLNELIEEN